MNQQAHGLYYVIPSQVFDDEKLRDDDILLYTLISGLATHEGYCFASDEWLATKRRRSIREIKRSLLALEKLGYIQRRTKKNGMYWDRKIFICHATVSKKDYDGPPGAPPKGHTRPFREDAGGPIESKPLESESSSSSSSPDSCQKETANREEEEPPPTPEEALELDRRWKESVAYAKAHGKRPPVKSKAWIAATLKDIRRCASIAPKTSPNGTGSTIEDNKAYSLGLENKSNLGQIKAHIEACPEHIEIRGSRNSSSSFILKYDDKSFKSKVLERLRIMGVSIELEG